MGIGILLKYDLWIKVKLCFPFSLVFFLFFTCLLSVCASAFKFPIFCRFLMLLNILFSLCIEDHNFCKIFTRHNFDTFWLFFYTFFFLYLRVTFITFTFKMVVAMFDVIYLLNVICFLKFLLRHICELIFVFSVYFNVREKEISTFCW